MICVCMAVTSNFFTVSCTEVGTRLIVDVDCVMNILFAYFLKDKLNNFHLCVYCALFSFWKGYNRRGQTLSGLGSDLVSSYVPRAMILLIKYVLPVVKKIESQIEADVAQ